MSQRRENTRREFLQGRAALDSLHEWTSGALEPVEGELVAEPTGEGYLVRLARRAMACDFEVLLVAGQGAEASQAALEALDLVDALEAQMTVYRDDSEIAQINRFAAVEPVSVESRLFELLQMAAELHERTAGALDITAGPLSKVWGFYRRQGEVPQEDDLRLALECVGTRHLIFDDEDETIRFDSEDVELNLGAIGKGYALDRCGELLNQRGVADFLLHGGKSSVLARGSGAGETEETDEADEADGGWMVSVGHPLRPKRRLATIRLRDKALATSGTAAQFFRHGGKRYGHILDPRTGWPAQGVYSATAMAPDAAVADALATAMYVIGPEQAMELCEADKEVAAILVCPGNREGSVEIHSAGFGDALELDEG